MDRPGIERSSYACLRSPTLKPRRKLIRLISHGPVDRRDCGLGRGDVVLVIPSADGRKSGPVIGQIVFGAQDAEIIGAVPVRPGCERAFRQIGRLRHWYARREINRLGGRIKFSTLISEISRNPGGGYPDNPDRERHSRSVVIDRRLQYRRHGLCR